MPKTAAKDVEINYKEEGKGVSLVLLHGLSDDSTLWEPLIPEFSKRYRTITLDIRGHGFSSKPEMPYSIELFSEDLSRFLEKLGISQAHLIGLSMGAAIVQQFALDHPEKVRSLTLLSTFSYIDPHLQSSLTDLRNSIVTGGLTAFFDEAVKLVVTAEFASANLDAIAEMKLKSIQVNSPESILRAIDACLNFNVKERISKISSPTLIISGREDVLTPLHLAEQIHRSIRWSKWKIMESVGHNLIIPEKIPELTQSILEFLENL